MEILKIIYGAGDIISLMHFNILFLGAFSKYKKGIEAIYDI